MTLTGVSQARGVPSWLRGRRRVRIRSRFFRRDAARHRQAAAPVASCVTYTARLACLSVVALATAAFIGVCASMVGGFYTSWSSVAGVAAWRDCAEAPSPRRPA